ncbi:MAG: GAF domain-containing sensor histidine kinase [Candidatus Omnitrophica bacterium]|nr:GAF domain-containing sensor histidine kinase [Candidatus Omnitrophota bacterium]
MSTWILDPSQILLLTAIAVVSALGYIGYLTAALASKENTVNQMQAEHQKLMRSFNELDEQAKLIVRTDLELNKAQEELDKRLNGINALQRTSRQISQALNESEIFQKLSPELFEELGFSMVLVAAFEDGKSRKRASIGIPEEKTSPLLAKFEKADHLKTALRESHAFSSINASRKSKEEIAGVFEAEHFILAPIVTQNGTIGFVFVGNRYNAPAVTQGDEELIGILASQIGQNIENVHLFEKVFRSSQELELKVKERTKQLAGALQQVEEINERKSEFISAVSHELRTPLTSIKGYAAILMAGKIGEVPDAVKERLGKINTHSDNLVALINNLLDIARIESGRVEMKFEPHPVKTVMDNISDLLAPQIKDKDIKLNINVPAAIKDIYIDISQAERVFINLLSNAVKFTPKAGTITIAASPVMEKGFITFHVMDTGIGIPPEDLGKLFNEFYRVDNEINQNVKGTGLGLTLAKNIVEAHHGKIWVKSQVGSGTTFSITLPASAEAYAANVKTEKII